MLEREYTPVNPTELRINIERTLEFNGKRWNFSARPLAVPYSLSTKLKDEGSHSPEFYLDWGDLVNNPQETRMHLYPGADRTVSFGIKLERMERWVAAIQLYDSMMRDIQNDLTQQQAEELVNSGLLPRPEIAVLDTATQGLRQLFETLQFPCSPEAPHPFTPTWKNLVEKTSSGELMRVWLAQKGR